MKDASFRVRTMTPEEVVLATDWAAAEGWNPGLNDARCFAAAAPDGFLLGELAGCHSLLGELRPALLFPRLLYRAAASARAWAGPSHLAGRHSACRAAHNRTGRCSGATGQLSQIRL